MGVDKVLHLGAGGLPVALNIHVSKAQGDRIHLGPGFKIQSVILEDMDWERRLISRLMVFSSPFLALTYAVAVNAMSPIMISPARGKSSFAVSLNFMAPSFLNVTNFASMAYFFRFIVLKSNGFQLNRRAMKSEKRSFYVCLNLILTLGGLKADSILIIHIKRSEP